MLLVKETYAPALLREKTRKLRIESGDERWWCIYDHQDSGFQRLKTNLVRPVRMIVLEPIWYCPRRMRKHHPISNPEDMAY